MTTARARNPLDVTVSVWHALFLREALDRLFEMRGAWLWLLLEPVMWISVHAFGYRVFHVHSIGGMEMSMWVIVGFVGFLLWRRTFTQVMHAIDCNRAYFAYRQVKPFDTAFVRAILEAFLMVLISVVILSTSAMLGYGLLPGLSRPIFFPDNPLLVILGLVGLWLFGLGIGLIVSVAMSFLPEMVHIYNVLYLPLYLLSGCMLPIGTMPPEYQKVFLANPVAHGVEIVREGFLNHYHTAPGVSISYLYLFSLGSIFFGLLLYRRFNKKLVMR